MSARPLIVDLDLEGAELLIDALQNAPELVTEAAWRASRRAARVLRPSIETVTPVDTGYLVSNTVVAVANAFTVQYENVTRYAEHVEARTGYVERGLELARGEVDLIYEQAFDDLARDFGSGR